MELQPIRTVIADHQPHAREALRTRLARERTIEVVAEARDGAEAVQAIRDHAPDLVFLEVEMPRLSGFEVLDEVQRHVRPRVVFVTAHDGFAARAFEVHALDYLLKPFDTTRFERMLLRVQDELCRVGVGAGTRPAASADAPDETDLVGTGPLERRDGERVKRLIVKKHDRYVFVPTEAVNWVESAGNYVRIHLEEATYMLRSTMSDIEKQLDPDHFFRIHRQHIVNIDRVSEVLPAGPYGDFDVVLETGDCLRMSRTYRSNLLP